MSNRAYPVYELENRTTGELWNCAGECSSVILAMVEDAKEHNQTFSLVLYKLTESQYKYFIEHHQTVPDFAVGTVLESSDPTK